jgi:hypothetical protein
MDPSVKPPRGRAHIEVIHGTMARIRSVLTPVHQYIDQRIANFARRLQCARMVSLAPNRPTPIQCTVERPRKSHRQSSHSARQRRLVPRLDDHVDVVRLHRKLQDAKPRSRRLGEASADGQKQVFFAHTRQEAGAPQRDVDGVAIAVQRPRAMRHPSPGRSTPVLAMGSSKRQCLLSCISHEGNVFITLRYTIFNM